MDFIEGYFEFFRVNGYAAFALVFAAIYLLSTAVKVGELILDVIKVRRGFYDR